MLSPMCHYRGNVNIRLMLYNTHRPGEFEQMLVENYRKRPLRYQEIGLDRIKQNLNSLVVSTPRIILVPSIIQAGDMS